jgi:hypothetical protein
MEDFSKIVSDRYHAASVVVSNDHVETNFRETESRGLGNSQCDLRKCSTPELLRLDPRVFCANRIGIWHVRHEGIGWNDAQSTGLEVFESLDDLRTRIHHKWAVVLDVFSDGLTAEHQTLKVHGARALMFICADSQPVARSKGGQLSRLHGSTLAAHVANTT